MVPQISIYSHLEELRLLVYLIINMYHELQKNFDIDTTIRDGNACIKII